MLSRYLKTNEVAEKLGISVRRVQSLIATGKIEAKKNGRDWEILESEVIKMNNLVRKAGRPSSRQLARKFLSDYVEKPSELYTNTITVLSTLLEIEGLDTVNRAFADVANSEIRYQQTKGLHKRQQSHVCVSRLQGKSKCPNSPENPCFSPDFPGKDHVTEWVKEGKTVKIISQPYYLSFEDMKKLIQYCDKNGLRADISAHSWHFPGRTILIDLSKAI